MADGVAKTLQLRLSRRDKRRLLGALVLSLVAHLLVFGGYKLAGHLNWRSDSFLPRWLRQSRSVEQAIAVKQQAMLAPEAPLMFVNVSPAQTAAEAPKDARFYSDKNSLAANPEADKETNLPKITGTQEQVVRTEEAQRKRFDQLQPATPTPPAVAQEETKPRPTLEPGDLTVGKPDFAARPGEGREERARPRTLAEARARLENRQPGDKMKQEGGVKRRLEFASLDAKATPFGEYDAAFINAVSDRWYALLEGKRYDGYQRGKVILQFALNSNGRITDMKVVEATVGLDLSLMCEMAVLDPSPYAPWPSDLRRLVDGDQRKVQFTFYYN